MGNIPVGGNAQDPVWVKVVEAKSTGRLVLSNCQLRELPSDPSFITSLYTNQDDFNDLHTIELNNNFLSALPAPILERLASLVVLNLSFNNLIALNPQFTCLRSLMKLDLSHNNLKSLDNLQATPCLQILYASHNKIERIPPDLNKNVSLQVLDFNHNLISDITPLHSLANIISLDLGYNGIREVSPQIFTLQNLEVLNLQNNVIQVLPKGIVKLRKLMFLFLQGNKLKSIPSDVSELKYLEELNLKDNDISMLPLSLGKLISHLKEIKLDGNNQMTIPNSLIRKQGTKAVLSYLSQEEEALSKMKQDKERNK